MKTWHDDITLTVFDEDVTTSDTVGTATIKASSLCVPGGIDDWFQIQYKGKVAGQIHLKGMFTADKPAGQPVQMNFA